MSNPFIRPVILCGGEGTRLWPLSRRDMPKQFARLNGKTSLLQDTLRRLEDCGFGAPILITHHDYRFTVAEQVAEIGVRGATILIEPAARNTAPAVCAAAELLKRDSVDTVFMVVPSDHAMDDQMALARAVAAGVPSARDGAIVTFGIRPDRAETGFGYIELSHPGAPDETPQPFRRFVEKPDAEQAEQMLATGAFLWNSGMFLMSVATAHRAFEQHAPKLRRQVRQAILDSNHDLDFLRLGSSYQDSEQISFDHAVMEHETGMVVPVSAGWNDMGSWTAVWQESARDEQGVSLGGNALAIECENSLLRSEEPDIQVVGLGLRNIAAVATRDAVLITDMNSAQDVSGAVRLMRQSGTTQADVFPRCERPWGHYETLSLGPRFQVKSIVVKPGGKLSLQSHVHRSEHWVVVEGSATVTIGSDQRIISENQSVYIPLGEVHRLENEGKLPLRLIEVQTGSYLGEDDITRYQDVYERA